MSEVISPAEIFGQRLQTALQEGLRKVGIEAEVETEPVPTTLLHRALVVAPQFAQLGFSDRQEVVWRIIKHYFSPDEQLFVSGVRTLTPAEMAGNWD